MVSERNETRTTMAEVSEAAEAKQKLNALKGRMLALKEHL